MVRSDRAGQSGKCERFCGKRSTTKQRARVLFAIQTKTWKTLVKIVAVSMLPHHRRQTVGALFRRERRVEERLLSSLWLCFKGNSVYCAGEAVWFSAQYDFQPKTICGP